MKTVVNTRKILKVVWPGYSTANTMCRILDSLEEGLAPYWYPYWDSKEDEIGIRFTTKEGVLEAFPGCVVIIEDGYAVRMRKNLKTESVYTEHGAVSLEEIAKDFDGELV